MLCREVRRQGHVLTGVTGLVTHRRPSSSPQAWSAGVGVAAETDRDRDRYEIEKEKGGGRCIRGERERRGKERELEMQMQQRWPERSKTTTSNITQLTRVPLY